MSAPKIEALIYFIYPKYAIYLLIKRKPPALSSSSWVMR